MEGAIPCELFLSPANRAGGWFSRNLRSWHTTTQHQDYHTGHYPYKGFCLLVLFHSFKFIKRLWCQALYS